MRNFEKITKQHKTYESYDNYVKASARDTKRQLIKKARLNKQRELSCY